MSPAETNPTKPICPNCEASQSYSRRPKGDEAKGLTDQAQRTIRICRRCEARYTPNGRTIYLGDSYTVVLPHFGSPETVEATEAAGRQRYYDLFCIGSHGGSRRHGWFDPQTKTITQVG